MKVKILITGGSGFIGTNLIETIKNQSYNVLNIDINEPKLKSHYQYWEQCDILESEKVMKIFQKFSPTHVLHLAARTDIDGVKIDDYKVNTTGTKNILNAVKVSNSIEKLVVTSSQFVHQFKGIPKSEVDYAPFTVYGESKMISEKLTRSANLDCVWTIIRPTNIWGPWHPRYPYEFWKVIGQGKYIHPGKKQVIRSYGYVKNVIYQIFKIFESDKNVVDRKVFYVGDEPVNLLEWVNEFSKAQLGKDVLVVPRPLVFSLAKVGDIFKSIGLNFPISTSRYESMITNNPAPMENTINTFGQVPYNLHTAVSETVIWLKKYYPNLVKI